MGFSAGGQFSECLVLRLDYNDRFMGRIQRHYGAYRVSGRTLDGREVSPGRFSGHQAARDLAASPELRTVG
jgi:hypothetical protein